MMMRTTVLKATASSLFLVFMAAHASAQDATAAANRLKAIVANQGTDLSWTGISGSGANVVLQGVTVKVAGRPEAFTIGDVALDGIADDNGGYTIAKVTFPNKDITEDGVNVKVTDAIINNLHLPAEDANNAASLMLMYDDASIGNITFTAGDKSVFSADNFAMHMTRGGDGEPMTFTGGSDKMSADLTGLPDASARATLEALGYQQITGNIKAAGTWNPADGKMNFTQYDMSVDNAGTFGMTFDLSGYTPDFIKQMAAVQKQMAANPGDKSATGMAMLGLMQQLNFNGATIKFTDASLTGKLLDFYAKRSGMDAKALANQIKAMVPFGLAQLNNPELATQASAAINAFLDNPKSLTITAAPAAPVPFAMLMANGMGDPTQLPKTLGLKVTSND